LPAAGRVCWSVWRPRRWSRVGGVGQARALSASAGGTPVGTTAADLGTWPKTVRRWRAKHLAGWRGRCGDDRAGSGAGGGSTPRWWRRSWPARWTRCPRTARRGGRPGRWRPATAWARTSSPGCGGPPEHQASAGARRSPTSATAGEAPAQSTSWSPPSTTGQSTGTTTPSPSCGTAPRRRSSPRSAADEPPSTRSPNPRRTTCLPLGVLLRNATPSVFHQRHIGRVLRSSCNPSGRRLASSRGREPQPGRCPSLWPGDLRNDGISVADAGADGSET